MRVSRIVVVSALILGFGARLRADIPFLWLDSPKGHDNPHDPKSPLFVPTSTPGSLSQYDSKDPNDNSVGGATVLNASASPASASYDSSHYIGYGTDTADYYSVNVTPGQAYDFTAVHSSGSGVMSIEIQPAGGGAAIYGPMSSASNAIVTLPLAGATSYVVVVKYVSGGVTGYDFKYQNTTGATPTNTPTDTYTSTYTITQTPTRTDTPTNTYTFTKTSTPTQTPTITNTPSGPTNTPTNTPTITQTPTVTNTFTPGGHNELIADFEEAGTNDKTLWETSVSSIYQSVDGGSSMLPAWSGTAASAPGAGNTSTAAACVSGNIAAMASNPYAQFIMELIATGGQSNGLGAGMDISPFSPNKGLSFDFKASTAGPQYRVAIVSTLVRDYGQFCWDFTPADTLWHHYTVYFPGQGGTNHFAQPSFAVTKPFDMTTIGGLIFSVNPAVGAQAYGFCVDNVSFDVPFQNTPTPTQTSTPAPVCNPACPSCITYENFEAPATVPYYYFQDAGGTIAPVASLTTSEFHSCASSLQIALGMGTTGQYAGIGIGSNFLTGTPAVISAGSSQYLRLWMKASANQTFQVTLKEANVTGVDPTNESWTSPNIAYNTPGAWQEIYVNLGTMSENIYNSQCAPNCLTTGNNTIDKGVIEGMELEFLTSGFTGNVYVDDVSFDPISVPTATPTPSSPGVVFTDFEDGLAASSYTYNDTHCTMSFSVDGAAAHTGSYGFHIVTDTTDPGFSYGAGAGTGPLGPATSVNATGLNNMTYWIKVHQTGGTATSINYVNSIKELNAPSPDPTNENWSSAPQTVSVFDTWQQVTIPLGSYTENIYNPDCTTPGCAATGNNVMDKNVLAAWDFQIATQGFIGDVYIDDIKFQ